MTLRHLQIFLVVCEKKNMTESAKALFMTQPSVSQVVKELEKHYGVTLFERTGRALVITRAGDTLRSYATHIVGSFEEVEKKLKEEYQVDSLRIGANVTVGVTMIQSVIKEFKDIYPEVRVEVFVNNSSAIRDRIDRNELDLALVEEFSGMDMYHTEPFFNDKNIIVAPVSHPILAKEDLTVKDLTSLDLMLREKGSGVRNLFDAILYTKGIVIHPIWESYTSDALIEAVKANLGLAVLPYRIARPHIEAGEMAELCLPDLDLSRKLVIMTHRSKVLSEEAEHFLQMVREKEWS